MNFEPLVSNGFYGNNLNTFFCCARWIFWLNTRSNYVAHNYFAFHSLFCTLDWDLNKKRAQHHGGDASYFIECKLFRYALYMHDENISHGKIYGCRLQSNDTPFMQSVGAFTFSEEYLNKHFHWDKICHLVVCNSSDFSCVKRIQRKRLGQWEWAVNVAHWPRMIILHSAKLFFFLQNESKEKFARLISKGWTNEKVGPIRSAYLEFSAIHSRHICKTLFNFKRKRIFYNRIYFLNWKFGLETLIKVAKWVESNLRYMCVWS